MNPASPAELHGYAYAGNNPITKTDPTGLAAGSWCVTQACMDAGASSPGLTGYGIAAPPAPNGGAGSKPAKPAQTVKILGGKKTKKTYFVPISKTKPWLGYLVTVSGTEYSGILDVPVDCLNVPVGGVGPCSPGVASYAVSWLEADHVTAQRYDCTAKGAVQHQGCTRAAAGPGKQSFGEDMQDLGKLIYDVSGAKDVVDCTSGSGWESCAWAAAAFVPFGLGKAAKAIEAGAKVGDGARTAARFEAGSDGVVTDLVHGDPKVLDRNPLAGTRYTEKVEGQIAGGDNHAFPASIDTLPTMRDVTIVRGGDGVPRMHVKLPGESRGQSGTYHWIIEADGTVNHRFFDPRMR